MNARVAEPEADDIAEAIRAMLERGTSSGSPITMRIPVWDDQAGRMWYTVTIERDPIPTESYR